VRVGFEPTDAFDISRFQDEYIKPLCHLTVKIRGSCYTPPDI